MNGYEAPEREKVYFVTGGAGFIGFHLCKRLLEAGARVTAYDNLNDYYDPALKTARLKILRGYPGFTFFKGDLADMDELSAVFLSSSPDIVVNLAAQAGVRNSIENPRSYIQSNIVGFFNILELCRHHPVEHLVYASSSSVYGLNDKIPFSTQDMTDTPISLYAATKKSDELMAHCYCHLYGIRATGLRFFSVYGPYGRPDMACYIFTDRIVAGQPIQIFNGGDHERDFTYIDDIVEGVVRVCGGPPAPDRHGVTHAIYNIGGSAPVKLMDFIATLERCLGREAVKEYLPMQPGDVRGTCADVSDLVRDFGFRPAVGVEDGVARFVSWYREYHGLAR